MTAPFAPSVHVGTVYERVSAKGTRYLSGRLGYARITLLPGEPADDGTPTWKILLQQAPAPEGSGNRPPRRAPTTSRQPPPSPGALPDDSLDDLFFRGER